MTEDKPKSEDSTDIRKQSEEVLKGKTTDIKKLSSGDAQKLVHELEVHQVELEMQNEELRKVQNELEETRNRYSDLYDFAPVGYFTFDKDGMILEVNLTGAKKLGRERSYLIKKPFSLYIAPDYKGAFYSHLQQVFDTGTQTTCELTLVDKKGHKFDVMLESIPARDNIGNLLARTAMSDITVRKLAEDALKKSETSLKKAQELGKIGNWELDLKTRKINWSDEVYVLYERDKILGPPTIEEEVKYYTPEVAKKLHEFACLATETSQEYMYDFAIRLPNGRTAFFNSSIIPVKDEIGNVIQLWGTVQDITERKRAENASQEARIYAESIIDTVREPFVVLDKDLKVLSASRSFYSTFEVTTDETVGNLIYDIGNRQWDIPSLRTLLEEILPKETQFNNYEVSHKFQTIGQKIMLLNARQIYQEIIGTPIILLAIEDITERRQMEIGLEESENRYRRLFEATHDGILILDADTGKITDVNPFLIKILGYSYEEFLGKELWEIGLFKDIVASKTAFLDLQTNGYVRYEDLPLKTKDGRNIDFEFVSNVYLVNNKKVIQCNIRDITDRKLAEKAFQEARIYAENIIETVRESLLVLDRELKVLSASRSFYSTFEVTADETVGNLIYDIGNRQWDIPSLRTLLEEILPKETQFNNYEVSHKFQTIGQKIMLLNARQIHQEVIGTPIILLAIEDITERKRVEEDLKKHREHLEELVNDRTHEMRLAKDEAVRASAVKTDLLMKMSHELRTPLNAILGFSSLLNMKDVGELNEKQEQYITTISKSGKHLLGIITDMLDLAKVQSGEKLPLSIESFPAQNAIDDTLIFVNEKATQNNIIIKKEIDPEIDIIKADKIRFKQILLKLLDNAIKFSKAEGGTILIAARKAGDMAQFSVSDTGIGIIQENIGKIFSMFYQEESGVSRKYAGTGVGLSIIKQLVEQHGGKLWVESTYGIGSTFTFSIPLKAKKGKIDDKSE